MDNVYNRVARRRRKGEGGFTLIELLVVIAVLTVLAAIILFNVVGVANRGKTSACQTDVKSIQTASDAYYGDNSAYSTSDGTTTKPFDPTIVGKAGAIIGGYVHVADLAHLESNTGAVAMDANGTITSATCP
jgi:general secretion pathway protein G